MADEFIERSIVTGLITSTQYLDEIQSCWSTKYLESATARTLSNWCWEYYRKYKEAPHKAIEGIFLEKVKQLPKDTAEDIQDILESLSDDAEQKKFNLSYLLDQTRSHFQAQSLTQFAEQIKECVETGEIAEAEKLAKGYKALLTPQSTVINPFDSSSRIKAAFLETSQPLVKFPKALGQFWNAQLARDSFVALMGPEKRGKTFMLIEIAMRALMSHCNTVFFQAGDMTENQFLRRLCIWMAGRSDKAKYCDARYVPTLDCWKNQCGTCTSPQQEMAGVPLFFKGDTDQKSVTRDLLVARIEDNPDYVPCYNCKELEGACFLKKENAIKPLTWKEAYQTAVKFRKTHQTHFKLATYPNETLTTTEINTLLDTWEKGEGFIPDVIVIDYADIMAPDADCSRLESRHQHNRLWQRLRRLSQERHCLVVTATQAAASSYSKETITLSDFSEDKRKFAHVTAMYGLNQTTEEKRLGILRLNELVVREDDFFPDRQIKILQCLQRGKPFIGSYF